jgi:hypothetical protein
MYPHTELSIEGFQAEDFLEFFIFKDPFKNPPASSTRPGL